MTTLNDTEKKIPVVAADNHRLILDQVVKMIDSDFEVVGGATDGQAALEMILQLKPEIAVLDISMPLMTGIEVAAELKKIGSGVKVVVLTAYADPDYLRVAIGVGVAGYVLKFSMATDLKAALDAVRAGKTFISPSCESFA